MHAIYGLYQLMPGKDCGACGSISCRQFARRLVAGEETAGKCTYLDADALEKAGKLLKEGTETYRKLPAQEEMLIVQPCASNSKKVMADGRIGRETRYGVLDTFEMCKLAKKCGLFKKQKCSEKLGIATFEYGGKEIVAYDNGRISVKQADSREEALEAIEASERILRASFLCPDCGGSAIDCAKGFCKCGMACGLLPKEKYRIEVPFEKMGAYELEAEGIGMLAQKGRAGILLIALAECLETAAKCGKGDEERERNNRSCIAKITKELKELK